MNSVVSLFEAEPGLTANVEEMKLFANTLFKRCRGAEGWIALRAFEHEGAGAAVENRWARFDSRLIDYAAELATSVAQRPWVKRAVFAPPVAIFGEAMTRRGDGSEYRPASAANVVCAPAIAVELDERPDASLQALVDVIGPPTLVVASGGVWLAPGGEKQDKLHAYWRLRVPATDEADQALLRRARAAATKLVDGDATAVSLAHPMRWPGSWHTKSNPPVLCRAIDGDTERDVELAWAAEALEEAVRAAGLTIDGMGAAARRNSKGFKTEREWSAEDLMDAARLIPNEDVSWDRWNIIGMAFWEASHASVDGLEAFHAWSEKDTAGRYDPDVTAARWSHWSTSPPTELSGGKLIYEIRQIDPDWSPASNVVEVWFDAGAAGYDRPKTFNEPSGDAGGEPAPVEDAAAPEFVREMNRRHAFVMNSGQAIVINDDGDGRISFSSRSSFFDRYANRTLRIGKKEQSVAEWWWEDPKRRQFMGGVDFDPAGVRPGVFNLWRGWPELPGGEAGEEGCPMILRHIREVVCDGDEECALYLIGWLAHMVQRPWDKPGVAVVLKGLKGVGKDTLGEYLQPIIGPYYMMVSAAAQVTGRFNAHLAGKILLHVEEALWAGNRASESVLKSLITAPSIAIEPKGVNPTMMKSRTRVLMTSNEDWVVPASSDERRFFVLEVAGGRRNDAAWFGAIRRELEGDGPACLRRYLDGVDLAAFDVRKPPRTEALASQQMESLRGFDLFWSELIEAGDAFENDEGQPWETAGVNVPRDTLQRLYGEWCSKRKWETPVNSRAVGKKLVEFTETEADKLSIRPWAKDGSRPRLYVFPSAKVCRAIWAKRFS